MKLTNLLSIANNKFKIDKLGKAFVLGFLFLGLLFASCSDDDGNAPIDTEAGSLSEVQLSSEMDAATEMIGDLIINTYEAQELSELGRADIQNPALPDCVTITVVAEQNYRELTLDFGTEGCTVNGHVLQGQIVYSYTRNVEAQSILLTSNLMNFYLDNKNVLGSRTILRELSNDNGNPQFTHTLDLTVIWPSGIQASREGVKVREWIEGFGSGVWTDNVFEVSGNWTTTFVNGNTHTYEVLIPLRREVPCFYFVSGTVDVQRTNFGGTFDYGNGDCDNQATFTTNNGNVFNITLNWQ